MDEQPDIVQPRVMDVLDDRAWERWADKTSGDIKIIKIQLHATTGAAVLALIGSVLVGRTVLKIVKAQQDIATVLAGAGLIAQVPTAPNEKRNGDTAPKPSNDNGTRPQTAADLHGVSYTAPQGHVTTGADTPVDPDLYEELRQALGDES